MTHKFIEAENNDEFKDYVAIQRTFRYRNQFVDYSFLNNFDKLLFIGIEEEFEDLKKVVTNLEFYNCKDFTLYLRLSIY